MSHAVCCLYCSALVCLCLCCLFVAKGGHIYAMYSDGRTGINDILGDARAPWSNLPVLCLYEGEGIHLSTHIVHTSLIVFYVIVQVGIPPQTWSTRKCSYMY